MFAGRILIAHMSLSFSGAFWPTSLPLFQGTLVAQDDGDGFSIVNSSCDGEFNFGQKALNFNSCRPAVLFLEQCSCFSLAKLHCDSDSAQLR